MIGMIGIVCFALAGVIAVIGAIAMLVHTLIDPETDTIDRVGMAIIFLIFAGFIFVSAGAINNPPTQQLPSTPVESVR